MAEEPKREMTTSSGKVLHLQPVSNRLLRDASDLVEREFEERGEPVAPPQYEVPMVGDGARKYFHDAESIKTATEEEKAAWAAHEDCRRRVRVEQNERTTALAIVEGVVEKPSEEWLARMAWMGFELPKDPYDLKVRYVTYEFLRTPQDMVAFSSATMLLSAGMEVEPEAVEAAMASFRDSVRGSSGTLVAALTGALGGGRGAQLDARSGVPQGEGREGMAAGTEQVRPAKQARPGVDDGAFGG